MWLIGTLEGLVPALGALAALTGVLNMVPYLRDTVRRATRPHRGTWLIWSVLAVVAYFSQRADGASWSAVMCGVQAAMNGAVLVLAMRYGSGVVGTGERLLLVFAAAGVVGWVIADDPVLAIGCVVVADLIAVAMMVPKSWCDPGSETLSTFALASLGGALAAGAAGGSTASLLLYPVYYCLANAALALLLWARRRSLRTSTAAG
jgi:hypothetical protein